MAKCPFQLIDTVFYGGPARETLLPSAVNGNQQYTKTGGAKFSMK